MFKSVREQLLELDLSDRWHQPIAFWACTTDRHLPMALVDKTLRYLVDTPLERLAQTPGIGPKKLRSLIMLMRRAVESQTALADGSASDKPSGPFGDKETRRSDDGAIDLVDVSEAVWSEWCRSLRSQRLEKEPLGRFAVTLQDLPRAMWRRPIGFYLPRSIREIRELKSHGEKRLTALTTIVGSLHWLTAQFEAQPHLSARIENRLTARLEAWFAAAAPPELDDLAICQGLLEPLIEQLAIDLGAPAAYAAREWLIYRRSSVQQVARRLGVARARIYEMFSEAALVIAVRWPHGRQRLLQLREWLTDCPELTGVLPRVDATIALLFSDQTADATHEISFVAQPLNLPVGDFGVASDSVFALPTTGSFAFAEVNG